MLGARPVRACGALGLGLLLIPLFRQSIPQPASSLSLSTTLGARTRLRRPFEQALRAGWLYRARAWTATCRQLERVEGPDAGGAASSECDATRRQILGRDDGGDLRRGRAEALRAVALA